MSNNRRQPSDNELAILLSEAENMCPICTISLMYVKNGRTNKRFEAAHIYPLNPTEEEKILLSNEEKLNEDVNHIDNFIALCRKCHKQYDHPRTLEEYKQLYKRKLELISRAKTRESYHDYQIELDIKEIINDLCDENLEEILSPLQNTALKLEDKTNETLSALAKRRIKNDITDYYIYIREQFRDLDKNDGDFELIALQIKTFYIKIKKNEKNQQRIYESLVEWLSKKTDSNKEACGLVIAFFIQNCEVF
jgi:hypothetical protein